MLNPLKHYADFRGRARRREFWTWVLLVWIATFGLMYLDTALNLGGSATAYRSGGSMGFNMEGGLLTIFFAVAMFIPNVAVSVRRLHDVGKSGWFLLFALIPFFGWIYLIYLYAQPGMEGPNSWGSDPKAAHAAKVFT